MRNMFFVVLTTILISSQMVIPIDGSNPPVSGDWIISTGGVYRDQTYVVNGSLIIDSPDPVGFENVTLLMEKEIELTTGDHYFNNVTIANQDGVVVGANLIDLQSISNVTITNSTIRMTEGSFSETIWLWGTQDVTIANNYFETVYNSITVVETRYTTIENNTFDSLTGSSPVLDTSNYNYNMSISHNILTSPHEGIEIAGKSQDSVVSHNKISSTNECILLAFQSGIVVSNNQCAGYMRIKRSNHSVIQHNVINTAQTNAEGIDMSETNSTRLINNTIYSDQTDDNLALNFWFNDNIELINNTVEDAGTALYLASNTRFLFYNNTMSASYRIITTLPSAQTPDFNHSRLLNNTFTYHQGGDRVPIGIEGLNNTFQYNTFHNGYTDNTMMILLGDNHTITDNTVFTDKADWIYASGNNVTIDNNTIIGRDSANPVIDSTYADISLPQGIEYYYTLDATEEFPDHLEIYVDGQLETNAPWDTSSGYSYQLPTQLALGVHNITLVFVDTSGNTATDTFQMILVEAGDQAVIDPPTITEISLSSLPILLNWTVSHTIYSKISLYQNSRLVTTKTVSDFVSLDSYTMTYRFNPSTQDSYNLSLVVTDISGNTISHTLVVDVLESDLSPTDQTATASLTDGSSVSSDSRFVNGIALLLGLALPYLTSRLKRHRNRSDTLQ